MVISLPINEVLIQTNNQILLGIITTIHTQRLKHHVFNYDEVHEKVHLRTDEVPTLQNIIVIGNDKCAQGPVLNRDTSSETKKERAKNLFTTSSDML